MEAAQWSRTRQCPKCQPLLEIPGQRYCVLVRNLCVSVPKIAESVLSRVKMVLRAECGSDLCRRAISLLPFLRAFLPLFFPPLNLFILEVSMTAVIANLQAFLCVDWRP